MRSREDLVKRALQKLRVVGAGQAPEAEDYQLVDAAVPSVLSELSKRNIYPYGDPDQLEDDAFEHLATCLAQACADDFGVAADEGIRIRAENRLREITAETLSYQPLQATYF